MEALKFYFTMPCRQEVKPVIPGFLALFSLEGLSTSDAR